MISRPKGKDAQPILASEDSEKFIQERSRARAILAHPYILLLTLAASSAATILTLGLWLGLGLKLKHHHCSGVTNSNWIVPLNASYFLTNASMAAGGIGGTTRYYEWSVEERVAAPDGVERTMLTVNGMYPGPTIEATQGDRIVVNLTNNLSNATSIHWHGLHQRGTNYYDGVSGVTQCGIPPGQNMVYNFSLDDWVGTTWWHSHYDAQYSDGLYGAIVVHAANESVPAYDAELVLELSDLYHAISGAVIDEYLTPGGFAGIPGAEPVPDGATINGVGQSPVGTNDTFFNVTLEANKTYRLRLINAGSFVAIRFSVDSHILTIIEADGTPVQPYQADAVSLAVAQRYSVLLTTNQSNTEGGGAGGGAVGGAFWIRAVLDKSAFAYSNPIIQDEVRAVLRYGSFISPSAMPDVSALESPPALPAGSPGDMNDAMLVPVGGGEVGDATFMTYYAVSMGYSGSQLLAYMNSTSYIPYSTTTTLFQQTGSADVDGSATYNGSQLITTVSEVHTVRVIVDNIDPDDHPFHMHGYKLWILATGDGQYQDSVPLNTQNPMLRDTVVIPADGYIVLQFVADNPGFWTFHCHIAWHMAIGLVSQFNILPLESAAFAIPQYMYDQCTMQ